MLKSIVLDALKLDDYIIANYQDAAGHAVNFYVANYASQRSGASAHSPRSCLPWGGWVMEWQDPVKLAPGLTVNRPLICKGGDRQLVYYWFKQRDRELTNEVAVKWYFLWDALTRNRTDGVLIRLTTLLQPREELKSADTRLRAFAAVAVPRVTDHVPD